MKKYIYNIFKKSAELIIYEKEKRFVFMHREFGPFTNG